MNLAATIRQSSLHNFLMRTNMSQNPIPKMFGWTGVCECKLTLKLRHVIIKSSIRTTVTASVSKPECHGRHEVSQ